MSRRISPRLREQASVVCAQMATWWGSQCYSLHPRTGYDDPDYPWKLAHDAFSTGPVAARDIAYVERWAEAEAMLRTGWTP